MGSEEREEEFFSSFYSIKVTINALKDQRINFFTIKGL